jgi:tRNA(fMet)-specific endonuclease VapC
LSGSYVLDTNVLLHLIRGQDLGAKIDQAFGLTSTLHRQIVSIVTQAELWVIADRKGWGLAKRNTLQQALDNLVVIPIDGTDLVEAYVRIARADSEAVEGARNMGKNDIWIAATAFYTQLPLLTTDKDFRFLHNDLLQVMWIDPSGV